jgi:hypothetical protein
MVLQEVAALLFAGCQKITLLKHSSRSSPLHPISRVQLRSLQQINLKFCSKLSTSSIFMSRKTFPAALAVSVSTEEALSATIPLVGSVLPLLAVYPDIVGC